VQDPGNIGGIIRTSEAAGATAVIVSPSSADPSSWKALRGSMGSALRVPIARASTEDAVQACRRAGIKTAAIVPRSGSPLFEADFRKPIALLVGGEGPGLPAELLQTADYQVSIPMHNPVESLNVGVAAALVLYEAFRQRSR
jgi:TrmH family RNA methyltransferase